MVEIRKELYGGIKIQYGANKKEEKLWWLVENKTLHKNFKQNIIRQKIKNSFENLSSFYQQEN